ncbi:MAG TPA: hypothetical protein VGE52_03035 [Pirellulales bacterium]
MIAHSSFFAPAQVGSVSDRSANQVLLPWADPYIAQLHAQHLLESLIETQGSLDEDAEILVADENCPPFWLDVLSAAN